MSEQLPNQKTELKEKQLRGKSMRTSVRIAGLTMALGIVAFGASQRYFVASAQQKPETLEVKIDNFSFGPAALTVPVGTTVTWANKDDIPHNVVSTDDPKMFKSKVLDTGEKFSFTFTKPGTFSYFCSLHPKMTGKVIVQ